MEYSLDSTDNHGANIKVIGVGGGEAMPLTR